MIQNRANVKNDTSNKIYRDIVLSQVPRILGFGDRDSASKTFGCFERYYWHYKLVDFPNARFQEAAMLLALLYSNEFEKNIYYRNDKVYKWLCGIIIFWYKLLNMDGSANETYPNERSFCATAFTTFAITESILLLKLHLPVDLIRTGTWLSKNINIITSNQIAAAIIALHNIFLITGKAEFRKSAEEKADILLSLQSKNGFYPEFLGYDIGYNSLTMSLLVKYYKKTKDSKAIISLSKANDFIEGLIDDNGLFNYNLCSRKTQYLYPYGISVLKSKVSDKLLNGLNKNLVVNPSWLDDRYVIFLCIDYLQAYLER